MPHRNRLYAVREVRKFSAARWWPSLGVDSQDRMHGPRLVDKAGARGVEAQNLSHVWNSR